MGDGQHVQHDQIGLSHEFEILTAGRLSDLTSLSMFVITMLALGLLTMALALLGRQLQPDGLGEHLLLAFWPPGASWRR